MSDPVLVLRGRPDDTELAAVLAVLAAAVPTDARPGASGVRSARPATARRATWRPPTGRAVALGRFARDRLH